MSRQQFSFEEDIHAPASKIWEVIALDFGHIKKYSANIRNSWYIGPKEEGVGTRRRCELTDRKSFIEDKITGWEHEQFLGYVVTGTSLPIEDVNIRFELVANGKGTLLKVDGTYVSRFSLLSPLRKKKLNTLVRDYLDNVRMNAEG